MPILRGVGLGPETPDRSTMQQRAVQRSPRSADASLREEARCMASIVAALHSVLDDNISITRDTETETMELLALCEELVRTAATAPPEGLVGQSPSAPLSPRAQRPSARVGNLLAAGVLRVLCRFLPRRLVLTARLRGAVLDTLLKVLHHAAAAQGPPAMRPDHSHIAALVAEVFAPPLGPHASSGQGPHGDGLDMCGLLLGLCMDQSGGSAAAVRTAAAECLFVACSAWRFVVVHGVARVVGGESDGGLLRALTASMQFSAHSQYVASLLLMVARDTPEVLLRGGAALQAIAIALDPQAATNAFLVRGVDGAEGRDPAAVVTYTCLLDILAELVASGSDDDGTGVYWTQIVASATATAALARGLGVCLGMQATQTAPRLPAPPSVFDAAMRLARAVLLVEGMFTGRLVDGSLPPLPVLELVCDPDAWEETISAASQAEAADVRLCIAWADEEDAATWGPLQRLALLRFAVSHAFTQSSIALVEGVACAAYRHLSGAVAGAHERLKEAPIAKLRRAREACHRHPDAVDTTDDAASGSPDASDVHRLVAGWDRLSEGQLVELTLLAGTIFAKSPSVRQHVASLTAGYASWAATQLDIMSSVLRHPKVADRLAGVVLVDAQQCLLNDGEQAQRVERFDERRIATAVIREQSKRYLMNEALRAEGIDPEGDFPLDQATIAYHLSCGASAPGRPYTPRIQDLTVRLCREVMVEACSAAMTAQESPDRPSSTPAPPVPAASPRAADRTTTPKKAPRGALPDERPMNTPYDRWMAQRGGPASPASPHPIVTGLLPRHHKEPFRPACTARKRTLTPPITKMPPPRPAHTDPTAITAKGAVGAPNAASIEELMRKSHIAADADEYLSIAIMMHMPVKYGAHYQRSRRAAVRHIRAPTGAAFVQPVHRNAAQSWGPSDVLVGEVYVLFLPFHRITIGRLDDEIACVQRHMVDVRKKLVMTPVTQRSRRWFLTDMINYVLPRTEMHLAAFRDLLDRYSADDVVYQMSVIRATDEVNRQREGVFEAAVEEADVAMPREVLRLSAGRFKDVLHSGNIIYATERLLELYAKKERGEGYDGEHPTRLREIEREMERLGIEGDDAVEPIFSELPQRPASRRGSLGQYSEGAPSLSSGGGDGFLLSGYPTTGFDFRSSPNRPLKDATPAADLRSFVNKMYM